MIKLEQLQKLVKSQRVAWVFLLVSLMLTAFAWYLADRYVESSARQRFSFLTTQVSQKLAQRLNESQTVLRASAGFIEGSDQIAAEEWHRFFNVLQLEKTHQSIQFVAYLPLLHGEELKRHELEFNAAPNSTYRVWPAGQRDTYAPIAFLEPESTVNRMALGFDAYADPVRRAVLDYAIDIGETAISPRVELQINAGGQEAGFLMYMPIYRAALVDDSIESRRRSIRGFTLAVIRIESFIANLGIHELDNVDFEIFDSETPHPAVLLYDNHPENGLVALEKNNDPNLTSLVEIPNRPRAWSVSLHATPEFRTNSERYLPVIIGFGGLIINFLLFLLVWTQGRHRIQLEHFSGNLQDRLAISEEVFSSAIETIGEAFVIYDAEDRLIYCNEEYREVYKRSAAVIEIGRSFEEIIRYGAERGQYRDANGRVDEWVAERMAQHRTANTEIIQQLDDGRWINIRERRTRNGHVVGIRIDLTEVYNAKEAAESASRAKSRFLATISHEIRTPMNGILGMAQVLLDPEIPPGKRDEHVRTILRSGQALLRLLSEILDLSKIEAGAFELVTASFSPRQLVEDTIQLYMVSALGKGLALRWHAEGLDDAQYLGDADRIRQMLSNLLGNAIKFTSAGEVVLSLGIISEAGDDVMLEFAVQDTGPGIPTEQLSKLFKPFSQLDDSSTRRHGGTGLGLSIVRQLARLMDGEAGVTSRHGEGARFWFQVKVKRNLSGARLEASAPTNPASNALKPYLNGRILVAEDNATHRLVITAILTRLGVEAVVVEDGVEAVKAVSAGQHFDLILLDLLMPNLDGISALHQIQALYEKQNLTPPPAMAITAQAYEKDREICLQAGMVDVLTKPIDFAQLSQMLSNYLPGVKDFVAAPAECTIDRQAALEEINTLRPLLQSHKFDAFAAFKRLQTTLHGSIWIAHANEIETFLNRMEFDQATAAADRLAVSLGEKT